MGGSLMVRGAVWRLDFLPQPRAVRHGFIAGSAWGIVTGLVIIAAGAWECGGVCLPDAALTVALSIAAGLGTFGPLAAFGARPTENLPQLRCRRAIAQPHGTAT
jgi:hypothetical protein